MNINEKIESRRETLMMNENVQNEEKCDVKTFADIKQRLAERVSSDIEVNLTVKSYDTLTFVKMPIVKQKFTREENSEVKRTLSDEIMDLHESEDLSNSEDDLEYTPNSCKSKKQDIYGSSHKNINKSSIDAHEERISMQKSYKCNICLKKFDSSSHLASHKQIHTTEKPFECNICRKKFNESSNLLRHVQTHTDDRHYNCNLCDKSFTQSADYTRHRRIHREEKHFECDICMKKFGQPSSLRKHKLIHGNERPFVCNFCTKKFNQVSNLNTHIRRIHTEANILMNNEYIFINPEDTSLKVNNLEKNTDKLFECTVCSKKFNHFSKLIRHKKIHSGEKPFKCNICDKTFTHAFNLNTHIRVHSGEKPFPCNLCDKKFNQSSTLRRHERIHTGEKPFECNICTMKFNQSASLRTHKQMHDRKFVKQVTNYSEDPEHIMSEQGGGQSSQCLEVGFDWFK